MYRIQIFLAVCVAMCALSSAVASGQATLSSQEAKRLTKTAHSREEYSQLENYYRELAQNYVALAHQEQVEMETAASAPVPTSKYPSAYERARNLHTYFEDRAKQANSLVHLYQQKQQELKVHDSALRTSASP